MARYAAGGYSLIEVLFALALVGTMIIATSAMLVRVSVESREARDQDLALRIAKNEIEVLRAGGYAALPESGSVGNTMLASLASSSASVAITDFNAETKQAVVAVSWRGADEVVRSVSLATLVTKTCGLP